MEIDNSFAKEHVDRWIKAWNDHNLKDILSHYSEKILFHSPKVKLVYPNRSSTRITNKTDLEEYFSLGLKKFPNLQFVPLEYFLKDHILIFEYKGTPDNKIYWSVMEKFEFNEDGLIEKSSVYYGIED
jgi:SnoaL-like domain